MRARLWTLSIFAAFLCYLLSVPLVSAVVARWSIATHRPLFDVPRWLWVYSIPYRWLDDNTPLKVILTPYRETLARAGIVSAGVHVRHYSP